MTADGDVKIANACSNPDLFWALKGGGGGFGVVTRVTLRTHPLPEFLRRRVRDHQGDLRRRLSTAHRQERSNSTAMAFQFALGRADQLIGRGYVAISMVFQGLDQQQAEAVWKPFFEWVAASPQDFAIVSWPRVQAVVARRFLGPVVSNRRSGSHHRRRSPRRAGGQYFLDWQPRRGGCGLVRLSVRLAAGFAARSGPAPKPRGCAFRGGAAPGRGAALQ